MKIHILYAFKTGPWGGANQFLHALRKVFSINGDYCETPEQTDILLFNLNPSAFLTFLSKIVRIKKKNPNQILVVRIDGPVFLIRDRDLEIDHIFFNFVHYFSDGVIFQSDWSREHCCKLGLKQNGFHTTILNAPDPEIFNRKNRIPFSTHRKIRIIATSWSSNWKKGFAVYKWLDENLNFLKYEITFVGNSPIVFKHIKQIEPINSEKLAMELKKHDLFITASQKDPCSNSLIEAMHCGMPAIALNDGGHPEIIGRGGELFDSPEEIPILLEKIINNYTEYQNAMNLPTMEDVRLKYQKFMGRIYGHTRTGEYTPKRFNFLNTAKLRWALQRWQMAVRWNRIENFLGIKKRKINKKPTQNRMENDKKNNT